MPLPFRLFRDTPRDAWLVGVTLAVAAVVFAAFFLASRSPILHLTAALSLGLAVWWCSNTVAHIHLHRPIFAHRPLNRAFSLWLTVLTGVPQSLWRHRHLWHHAGEPQPRLPMPWTRQAVAEFALVALLLAGLAVTVPRALALAWLPGFLLGMALCQLQGWAEHALPEGHKVADGISFHAGWYNALWFNDGFHAEHHRKPAAHWTTLPGDPVPGAATSQLVPALRWIPHARAKLLAVLENLALRSPLLQRFMVRTHTRAMARLLRAANLEPRSVAIVGGGIFPRTVLVLAELLPGARCTIVDADAANVDQARDWLRGHGVDPAGIAFRVKWFEGGTDGDVDLVVLPLAVLGDLPALRRGVRGHVMNHAWLWQPGRAQEGCIASVVVSPWLLKRANLYRPM